MSTASPARNWGPKNRRLELRVGAEERRILAVAAAASGMSVGAYVLSHATDAARDAVADRTSFVPPAERWNSFVAMLDGTTRQHGPDGEGGAATGS